MEEAYKELGFSPRKEGEEDEGIFKKLPSVESDEEENQ